MRSAVALAVLTVAGLATPAIADTFGGFSGVDRHYLVNRDKVCAPLAVKDGAASGSPQCETATADVVAKLSMKEPISQKGVKGSFTASASGRALTVARKSGEAVVTWNAPDPITKVVDVYASQYEDRVAVAYTIRRLGKEVTDVVAFELVKTTGRSTPLPDPNAGTDPSKTPTQPTQPTQPTTAAPADPKLTKAVAAARKAPKGKAVSAWNAVLAIDADNSEARYRIAASHMAAKKNADAIATLEALAKSTRADAVEWLVEARFDKAFSAVRGDAKYRAAVGLDRPGTTTYERVMGFGGAWEQAETHCDKPQVTVNFSRNRELKVRVRSSCRGRSFDIVRRGHWQLDPDDVVLTVPTKGKSINAQDQARCGFDKQGDEEALVCDLGTGLDFTALPVRR